MSSLDQLYIKQKGKLFSLYQNKLPQSIILSGWEIELLSGIAISFAELIVKNNIDRTFEDFLNICSNGNHKNSPFVYMITKIYLEDKKRFKNEIYRNDISNIHTFFQTKDEIGQKRVCIIKTIDDLSIEASNSLLKLIEEPNKNSHFIIINQNKAKILQTIKSRSYFLNFGKLDKKSYLNSFDDSSQHYEYYFNLTNGSLELSKKFEEHNLHIINEHFKNLICGVKIIKSNTPYHYLTYVKDNYNEEDDKTIFFNFLQLIVSNEIKKIHKYKSFSYILKLSRIYQIINDVSKNYSVLNMDFENSINSLFYQIKNV